MSAPMARAACAMRSEGVEALKSARSSGVDGLRGFKPVSHGEVEPSGM